MKALVQFLLDLLYRRTILWYTHDFYLYLQVEDDEKDEGETPSQSDSTVEANVSQFRINDILAPSYLPPRVLQKVHTYVLACKSVC